ncbi:MAG: DUF61 family protein [Candidatus Methanofastidiosia archaeon]
MSDKFLKLIKHELKSSWNLPKRRKTLFKLLSEEKPYVKLRRGKHNFKREDLKKLSEIVPKLYHSEILLPIVLLSEEYGFKILGGRFERALVQKLLGKQKEFNTNASKSDFLYSYQALSLKRKFETLFILGFMI